MNSFAVFFAIIAVASANVAGRTGWDSSSPPAEPINLIALDASAVAVGEGQALASQELQEGAVGNAVISSTNGVSAVVAQEVIDPGTYSYNGVSASNLAQGSDSLVASIEGDSSAYVINSASTDAAGAGAIAIEASSTNLQINPAPAPGWRRP